MLKYRMPSCHSCLVNLSLSVALSKAIIHIEKQKNKKKHKPISFVERENFIIVLTAGLNNELQDMTLTTKTACGAQYVP